MIHLVLLSGGVSSSLTALWVKNNMQPGDELHLLFCDTLIEDEDLYRYLLDSVEYLCPDEFIVLADGRTPWQTFFDAKFLGNSRVDICSRVLKREITQRYVREKYNPLETRVYVGMHFSEEDRFYKAIPHWSPFVLCSPLATDWFIDGSLLKQQWVELTGIPIPRLYLLGFPHNNCGGFCVKAGLRHFKHLLQVLPEVYAYHEDMEQKFREYIGKDVAILRLRRKGETRPITLRELRLRIEAGIEDGEGYEDYEGCSCMLM